MVNKMIPRLNDHALFVIGRSIKYYVIPLSELIVATFSCSILASHDSFSKLCSQVDLRPRPATPVVKQSSADSTLLPNRDV